MLINIDDNNITLRNDKFYSDVANTMQLEIDSKPLEEKNITINYSAIFTPKRIIRNGPVTVVFWEDGTKTIVRLKEGTNDDPYMAFCSALAKKIFENNSKVKKIVAKTRLELPKETKR